MESRTPSTPRSRLAGGGEQTATARRSSRVSSNAGPASQAAATSQKSSGVKKATKKSVEMWSERGPKESSDTYCSRMTARFAEYDRCGKELRLAREDLRVTQNLTHSAKKNKPELKKRITALKSEIAKLEERRAEILQGSGFFKEKMENENRFAAMKSPGKVEVDDGESSGGEDGEESEVCGGGVKEEGKESVQVVEEDAARPVVCDPQTPKTTQDSYIEPAQVALPVSEDEEEDMEGEAGGLLRAIVMQESPTNLQHFTFGDDECEDVAVKRKRAKKQKTQESVQYVFRPFQQSGSAAKLVLAAGPPKLPDPLSVVEGGQHGGNSMASEKAADAIDKAVKPTRPAGREGQDGPVVGSSGAAGHSPVRGASVQVPERGNVAACVKGSGPPSNGKSAGAVEGSPCTAGGETGVRPEGQPLPPSVTSAVTSQKGKDTGTSGTAGAKKTILKPATLSYVPASSGQSAGKKGLDKTNVDDGSSCGVNERGVSGGSSSSSGVNERSAGVMNDGGSSSGMNEKSAALDGKKDAGSSSGVNVCSESVGGSGSGPAAAPVTTAPRSYANVAAGGSGGSPSPSGSGSHLQQRLLEALRRGDRSIQVEGRGEVDLSFWIERHGLGAFREQNGEVVWSLPTAGQDTNRRNVVRLVWRGEDRCPPRAKVVELLLQMEFRACDIFALIHPYGSSEFDVSFVRPEGLELFWSNYEVAKDEPGWRDFAVKAISRQNSIKKVTVLTRNESLSCYDIMTWLGRYGDVTGLPKKNYDEHGIWSGAWTFSVKLKRSGSTVAHIPSAAFLGRDRIQVFYQGQPKLCHRCNSPTHFSATCNVTVCALCGGLGHLAGSCRQIRCHLCGVLGHPFSRCPSAFARAAATPAEESCEVPSAGEGTAEDGGATGLVTKKKGPSKLRREENRRRSRELESAQVTEVAPAPAPGAGPETAEALEEDVLDEEIRRLRKEEGNMADHSDSSHYESVDEESVVRPKKKGKGNKKGKKKGSEPPVPCTAGQIQNGSPTAPPLIDLSNRYLVLDTTSSPSLEGDGKGEVPREKEPPGGTGPCPVVAPSSEGRASLGPDGDGDQMDQSESKKRPNSGPACSSSSGDEGTKKKGKQK